MRRCGAAGARQEQTPVGRSLYAVGGSERVQPEFNGGVLLAAVLLAEAEARRIRAGI